MAGHQLVQMALETNLIHTLAELLRGGTRIEQVVLIDHGAGLGRTLAELGLLDPGGAHILAVRRAGGEMHVSPALALRLEAGDLIFALGSEKQLKELSSRLL